MKRLKFLLEKSGAYATILSSKLAKQQEEAREKGAQVDVIPNTTADAVDVANDTNAIEPVNSTTRPLRTRRGRSKAVAPSKKRKATDADYQLTDYLEEEVNVKYLCIPLFVYKFFILNSIFRMSKRESIKMVV